MARNPFQQLHVIRKASQKGQIITDCYRLMYKRELWMKAYAKLYPNQGNVIKKSLLQKIDDTIDELKAGTYRFTPLRRVSTPTLNQTMNSRIQDQLTQEVMRMILEHVYDPIFSIHSHFREGRSCHTALSQIKNSWIGLTWCLKADCTHLFAEIAHSDLLKRMAKKINDRRFLLLLHNVLTNDVMKRCPSFQEILAPILTNIYFHEFDLFMEKLLENINTENTKGNDGKIYVDRITFSNRTKQHIIKGSQQEEGLVQNSKEHKHSQSKTLSNVSELSKCQNMKYVRYGGDFVIGIAASKQTAVHIKDVIKAFLKEELHLELSNPQFLLTHLEKPVYFLGYEFSNQSFSLNNKEKFRSIKLEIPERKMREFAQKYGYGTIDNLKSVHRGKLINNLEIDILFTYNAELRKIATYYKLANNYHHLRRLFFLAESSFIKTLANKRRSTSMEVVKSMRKYKQGALCLMERDQFGNETLHSFVKLKDVPKH